MLGAARDTRKLFDRILELLAPIPDFRDLSTWGVEVPPSMLVSSHKLCRLFSEEETSN